MSENSNHPGGPAVSEQGCKVRYATGETPQINDIIDGPQNSVASAGAVVIAVDEGGFVARDTDGDLRSLWNADDCRLIRRPLAPILLDPDVRAAMVECREALQESLALNINYHETAEDGQDFEEAKAVIKIATTTLARLDVILEQGDAK
jgi:hypothetical protein